MAFEIYKILNKKNLGFKKTCNQRPGRIELN